MVVVLLAFFTSPALGIDSAVIVRVDKVDALALDDATFRFPPAPESSSTTFDLNYGIGLFANQQAKDAFDRAAARWSALLADPVEIEIDVDVASLGSGILGQTSSYMMYGDFDDVRDLVADGGEAGDTREQALLANLPTFSQFNAYLPALFEMDGYGWLSKANYRALGGTPSGIDGEITFSTNFEWDYDPSDGIDAGKFDFEGVAVHEMGHVLGFSSEVDYVDWMLSQGRTADDVWARPLDFFRFDTADLESGFDFTSTSRNLTPGGEHSFYYGDGSVAMSTGAYEGDARQASHWKDDLGLGMMDPTAAPGELLVISEQDLIALDLIGWDVLLEVPLILGDVNGDGLVGGEDLITVINNWGMSVTGRQDGDLNGDGFVGGSDYNEVLFHWGTSSPAEPIPEPATLILSVLATLICSKKRQDAHY